MESGFPCHPGALGRELLKWRPRQLIALMMDFAARVSAVVSVIASQITLPATSCVFEGKLPLRPKGLR
jgi:hypothetical protein